MSTLVLVDGQPQNSLPTTDRGLQYGDGVFETIRLLEGQPLLWPEHRQRLLRGCARLGIPCNPKLVEERLGQTLALLAESATAQTNSHYQ
jgi:4-amino-4-deoxychorismate lyase